MYPFANRSDTPRQDSISLQLAETFRSGDPLGTRLGQVFRDSFDQAYNGQLTGRYSISQLSKTEAAHIGSLVEINIRREFEDIITDGEVMDFGILGYDVDCKYSKQPFGWMIPLEALGHFTMLCHADDETGLFRVGFCFIRDEILTRGGNRDLKRSISKIGRSAITWSHFDQPMPQNILLRLTDKNRELVLEQKSGAARLNMLFRVAQKVAIPRATIATVAQQKDYMKRLRYNGGSRSALQPEGIIILGDYRRHRAIAAALGLPIPQEGESIAARVFPSNNTETTHATAEIAGSLWRLAEETDPVVAAPIVPFS